MGYTLGTAFLQRGYQRGGALTVAGLSTLLSNAVPILAATLALKEPVPSGALGVARVLAFAAVTLGAVVLSAPDRDTGHKGTGRASRAPTEARPTRPAHA